MIPRFPTLDHIIPKILGGSNQQDNLQLLCIACHRIKDDLSGYSKNKSDLYKMLKISFIQEYDGFASIIIIYVLHKKSAIEKNLPSGMSNTCRISRLIMSFQLSYMILLKDVLLFYILVSGNRFPKRVRL